jgi:hypothetical protein
MLYHGTSFMLIKTADGSLRNYSDDDLDNHLGGGRYFCCLKMILSSTPEQMKNVYSPHVYEVVMDRISELTKLPISTIGSEMERAFQYIRGEAFVKSHKKNVGVAIKPLNNDLIARRVAPEQKPMVFTEMDLPESATRINWAAIKDVDSSPTEQIVPLTPNEISEVDNFLQNNHDEIHRATTGGKCPPS